MWIVLQNPSVLRQVACVRSTPRQAQTARSVCRSGRLIVARRVAQVMRHFGAERAFKNRLLELAHDGVHRLGRHWPGHKLVKQHGSGKAILGSAQSGHRSLDVAFLKCAYFTSPHSRFNREEKGEGDALLLGLGFEPDRVVPPVQGQTDLLDFAPMRLSRGGLAFGRATSLVGLSVSHFHCLRATEQTWESRFISRVTVPPCTSRRRVSRQAAM